MESNLLAYWKTLFKVLFFLDIMDDKNSCGAYGSAI